MVNLSNIEPERLWKAVSAVLEEQTSAMPSAILSQQVLIGRLPTRERLKAGARESAREQAADVKAARYFQSLLELGYLVASADGLSKQERNTLARLIEYVTGAAVDREMLELHFSDLDAMSDVLGRPERLGRIASEFESVGAREEAVGFSALVAIADGDLTEPEMKVLLKLGEHFSLSEREVRSVVDEVAGRIERALGVH